MCANREGSRPRFKSRPEGDRLSTISKGTGSSTKVRICVQTDKDQDPGSNPGWGGGLSAILRGSPESSAKVSICVQIEKGKGPSSSPGWGWGWRAKCNIKRNRVRNCVHML